MFHQSLSNVSVREFVDEIQQLADVKNLEDGSYHCYIELSNQINVLQELLKNISNKCNEIPSIKMLENSFVINQDMGNKQPNLDLETQILKYDVLLNLWLEFNQIIAATNDEALINKLSDLECLCEQYNHPSKNLVENFMEIYSDVLNYSVILGEKWKTICELYQNIKNAVYQHWTVVVDKTKILKEEYKDFIEKVTQHLSNPDFEKSLELSILNFDEIDKNNLLTKMRVKCNLKMEPIKVKRIHQKATSLNEEGDNFFLPNFCNQENVRGSGDNYDEKNYRQFSHFKKNPQRVIVKYENSNSNKSNPEPVEEGITNKQSKKCCIML